MSLEELKDLLDTDSFEKFEIFNLDTGDSTMFDSLDELPEDLEFVSFDCRNGKTRPILTFNVVEE